MIKPLVVCSSVDPRYNPAGSGVRRIAAIPNSPFITGYQRLCINSQTVTFWPLFSFLPVSTSWRLKSSSGTSLLPVNGRWWIIQEGAWPILYRQQQNSWLRLNQQLAQWSGQDMEVDIWRSTGKLHLQHTPGSEYKLCRKKINTNTKYKNTAQHLSWPRQCLSALTVKHTLFCLNSMFQWHTFCYSKIFSIHLDIRNCQSVSQSLQSCTIRAC